MAEVASAAGLLDPFNREYDTPTPGEVVLTTRLGRLLGGGNVGLGWALLAAAEALTRQRGGELLEINVDGGDAGARRFYDRHGYVNSEPGEDQQLLYYYRELGNATS